MIRNERAFRFECPAMVTSISCAENVGIVACGTEKGDVLLWNLETNTQFGNSLTGHSSRVGSIAITGDGRVLISNSHKGVRLCYLENGNVIRSYERHCPYAYSVSISGNGERAVSSSGNTITVWNTAEMSQLRTFGAHEDSIRTVAFSKNGEHLVTADYSGYLKLWNLNSQEQVGHQLSNRSTISEVSMSRNTTRVAAGFMDGTARVWEMTTKEHIGTPLRPYLKLFPMVALNGDGNRLILGSRENISVWDVSDEAEERDRVRAYSTNSPKIRCLTYCHETGTIASASYASGSLAGSVILWNSATGLQTGNPISLSDDLRSPYFLVMSGNGKKIAVAAHGRLLFPTRICVWDVQTRMEIGIIELGRLTGEFHVWMSTDGRYLASKASRRDGGKVRVWDADTLNEIVRPPESILDAVKEDAAAMQDRSSEIVKLGDFLEVVLVNDERVEVVLGSFTEHTGGSFGLSKYTRRANCCSGRQVWQTALVQT